MEINREIKNITSAFVLEDNLTECVPYGSGHINDTYRLTYGTGTVSYTHLTLPTKRIV